LIGLGVNNRVAGPMAKNFSKKGAVFEGLALSSIFYQILTITMATILKCLQNIYFQQL
jgi:hypothetical protein